MHSTAPPHYRQTQSRQHVGIRKASIVNKNVLRASLATTAITSAILIGIGSGTATAKPILNGDPGGQTDVQLSSDAPVVPPPAPESWTCAVLQGLNLGFESGTSLNAANKVQVNPMIGDWKPGPVNGFCLGSHGFTPIPGTAQ